MFQKLRNKVNAVLPDIESIYTSSAANLSTVSSPLKTINPLSSFATTSVRSTANDQSAASAASSSQWPNTKAINFNAGCALLQRNEETWQNIHATNEANAQKASECDRLIRGIKESIAKHDTDLTDINASIEQIPNILRTVAGCSAAIGDINHLCADIGEQMFELEDLLEVLELQEKQLDQRFEMAMFKERKLADLEKVRQDLAVKHAESLRACEQQMLSLQQERQAVFQDAFLRDMSYYKEVGQIPKIENKISRQALTLEEVVLDDGPDTDALDRFLQE